MRTIIEPFRIKMTEPLAITTREQREKWLREAHFNIFLLSSDQITIDLLTDSGTGAMSTKQWAALMMGDETYAGSRSWFRFRDTVQLITGFKHVFPVHQGRAGERILSQIRLKPGHVVPNNGHFDTTRANIEWMGAQAINLVIEEGNSIASDHPFKGNMDIDKLKQLIDETGPEKIPFGMITVTNNSYGGQPVSLENIRETKAVLASYNIPLIIDSARFAENAFFIHKREKGREKRSLLNLAQEIFSYADATIMSAKKDGLANIGGFFACNDDQLAEDFKNLLILTEGFPTYGGLAGRDLEVIAVGLLEALEMDYQIYRHATVEYMEKKLRGLRYPIVRPVGGHAIYVDAKQLLPHVPPLQFPGIALVNEMYLEGGVRAVEMGSVMFASIDPKTGEESPAPSELVRLTFPRRVYTQSHFDYIVDTMKNIWEKRESMRGYSIVKQPPFLRHFSAHFEPVK